MKINVTNAYAGSLAWSNFFARLTHSHPGRVVWVMFNTLIALMLMELDVFQALGRVLGLYSNIAISWMMAVVADLVINKPLGLSPPGIEFKRAHLYDVNPVGVGAMGIASGLSACAYLGWFGPGAQAFSALVALVAAMVAAPAIAWATGGRYYIARPPSLAQPGASAPGCGVGPGTAAGAGTGAAAGAATDAAIGTATGAEARLHRCVICEREYESDDMAQCPAYQGTICSLCCSLDARCDDHCKPHARLASQWNALLSAVLPRFVRPFLANGLGHYLLLMFAIAPALALLFGLAYQHELRLLGAQAPVLADALRWNFLKVYAGVLLVAGVLAWWLVLTHKSRQVAQEESNRQTHLLMQEIDSHKRTDAQLQQAKRQADLANQAKTRYISTISHELRTPLNSILGYAQLLDEDEAMPQHRRQAVRVIRRGGDHLLSVIEGTLDIARIEGGKLRLEVKPMRFRDCVMQIAGMFELQAAAKGIRFTTTIAEPIPEAVRADERRLRQILINVLGNAVKFTREGEVAFRLSFAREMARFEIEDTGPGIAPQELGHVFEPFARGSTDGSSGGTGLGLTISKMLTDLMGGEMTVQSTPGRGSLFCLRLFLPQARVPVDDGAPLVAARIGYQGLRRTILTVDNEEVDRELLLKRLSPLGFEVAQAASGEEALALLRGGLAPDAILMDLAMPGIDGWETLRRLRAEGLGGVPVAVVSANAFDKGLDNDVGIAPDDFIVKPVRMAELLDWLGRRLALEWVQAPRRDAFPAQEAVLHWPPAGRLRTLEESARLGYYRGVQQALDGIEADDPAWAGFVARARSLAREFQFEAMAQWLRRASA